jgi:hypothetical protein
MLNRKLACIDARKDPEQGVFAGARVDVHAVARDPSQNLSFIGSHGGRSVADRYSQVIQKITDCGLAEQIPESAGTVAGIVR